jgi:hypothetical protein
VTKIFFIRLPVLLPVLFVFLAASLVRAQVQTILYSVTDPGTTTGPTNWGVNTLSTTDIQRDLLFMGSNTVNFVLVAFQTDTPQTNNSLNSGDVAVVTNNIIAASMVSTTNWVMSFGSGAVPKRLRHGVPESLGGEHGSVAAILPSCHVVDDAV